MRLVSLRATVRRDTRAFYANKISMSVNGNLHSSIIDAYIHDFTGLYTLVSATSHASMENATIESERISANVHRTMVVLTVPCC